MGIALLLLVRMLEGRLSRAGRMVGRVAGAGFIVAGVANGIEHCAHLDAFGLLYVFGLLIGVVAAAVFGVFLARSRAVAAWVGWVLSLAVLGFFASAEQGGAILIGIALSAVGIRLVSRSRFHIQRVFHESIVAGEPSAVLESSVDSGYPVTVTDWSATDLSPPERDRSWDSDRPFCAFG